MATDHAASAAGSAAQRHLCWADARRIAVVAIIALATGCTSLDGAGGARLPAQHAVLDDLATLIECRGDAGVYTRVLTALIATMATGDAPTMPGAGPVWTIRKGDVGPYVIELELSTSITVAGHRTRHVAFQSAGAMTGAVAYLDGTSPARVAHQLGLTHEPGEPDEVWSKEFEPAEGDAGMQNISLHVDAVMERDDEGEGRVVRGPVMVACVVDPSPDVGYD
ncbi:hypothetical protein [Stenotrophomonas rhizophila]|uniref:hypothetical protein n=1 Tax=Stenotrophomonas rhizophila TaxID=216778 RepID=UPI001639CDEA|nr:hypothetical protein [Stenotrophomonas rhizophila]